MFALETPSSVKGPSARGSREKMRYETFHSLRPKVLSSQIHARRMNPRTEATSHFASRCIGFGGGVPS
jgi:hypothetical protein